MPKKTTWLITPGANVLIGTGKMLLEQQCLV